MGEDRIELGTGTLYYAHTGEPIGTVTNVQFTEEDEDAFRFAENFVRMGEASQEFSFSVKMASDAYTRFVHTMLGIDLALTEMCPNRRVVHLAKHAKKNRTRKKNYKRMIRMCERYGNA